MPEEEPQLPNSEEQQSENHLAVRALVGIAVPMGLMLHYIENGGADHIARQLVAIIGL